MPLKDWPPTDDWPPKETPEQFQGPAGSHDTLSRRIGLEQRATTLDMVEKRPEQPSLQATDAQAAIEEFKRELAALEESRNQLRESSREMEGMKQSVDHAAALRTELDQIRGVAGQLGDDYARLRDASREAREGSAAAADVVQEVERKLGWLEQRVTEIQTTLDGETRRRDEFVQETARMENDGRALAATIATHVERLALEKKQFETFEQRMEKLIEHERQLSYLPERLEEFSRIFEALTNQADELRRKQASLEPLQEQLNALQAMASDMDEKFTALFARQAELAQKSDEFEQKLMALADREPVVRAVKEELDTVHQMSEKSKADLQYLSDHGEDLSLLRRRLEELLTLTAAAEQKIRR